MTSRPYADWTVAELAHTIASDEGVLRKEGVGRSIVDPAELAAMRRELTRRWIEQRQT